MNNPRYKVFFIIVSVYLAIVVLVNFLISIHGDSHSWDIKLLDVLAELFHMMIDVTIIKTLVSFNENKWRKLPFWILIADEIVFLFIDLYFEHYSHAIMVSISVIGIVTTEILCVYTLISCFLVKSKQIHIYLKAYGFLVFAGVSIANFLPIVLYIFLKQSETALRPIFSLFYILHTIPLMLMYATLYKRHFTYQPGDAIISIKEFENLPVGSMGTIIARHAGSDYYDVEFAEEEGNALNIITMSAKDIDYAPVLGLQTRVDGFDINR